MTDPVAGQRESSEAGGQERERRGHILPTWEELADALDAANSRAEEAERAGMEWKLRSYGKEDEITAQRARIRELEAALRWHHNVANARTEYVIGDKCPCLSQATNREHVGDIRGVPIVTDPSMEPGKIQARATKRESD